MSTFNLVLMRSQILYTADPKAGSLFSGIVPFLYLAFFFLFLGLRRRGAE